MFLIYLGLTDASKKTLVHQGGRMTEEEILSFNALPNLESILRTRRWDEQGKSTSVVVKPLAYYKEMCRNYLKGLTS